MIKKFDEYQINESVSESVTNIFKKLASCKISLKVALELIEDVEVGAKNKTFLKKVLDWLSNGKITLGIALEFVEYTKSK